VKPTGKQISLFGKVSYGKVPTCGLLQDALLSTYPREMNTIDTVFRTLLGRLFHMKF
jgi:hypothetical protein